MRRPEVLIIGLGGVGSWAMELLARSDRVSYVVGADVNEAYGQTKVDVIASGALLQGFTPRLEFVGIDLRDVEATAETLGRLNPRLIFNCATYQTWWVRYENLSQDAARRLGEAGSGPWLPTHLALARKLMMAVRASGWDGLVINCGYSDASNMILSKRGWTPSIGLGNIDLLIPRVQMGVARRLHVPVGNVSVYGIWHHYHLRGFAKGPGHAPPYFLRILVGDLDVTGQFDTDQLLYEVSKRDLPGEQSNPVVATSGVKNALAMLDDTGLLSHSPGPQGLPGGYPIRLTGTGADVFLPEGVTLEEAITMNEAGQRGDGIERIDDDGTVFYTEKAVRVMKEVLNYDLTPLSFDDCDERAERLVALFKNLAAANA